MHQFTYTNRKKEEVFETAVRGDMVYRWVNLDDPTEFFDVPWTFVGQQADAAQALGAGLTYTNRYFLMKFFQIATSENDPDNFRSRQLAEENKALKQERDKLEAELSPVRKEIFAELSKIDDNRSLQKTISKKIAELNEGKTNPNTIKDMETAQKVLVAIKTMIAENTVKTSLTKDETKVETESVAEVKENQNNDTKKKEKK